jgi:hypothetical protein
MKYFFSLLFLAFSFSLQSCEDDVEILKIERSGLMTLKVNGQDWVASSFKLNNGPLVVINVDSPNVGRSFRRYALIGQGTEPGGRKFQISIIFDLSEQENFIGTYNSNYTFEKGGLHEITLNVETAYLSNYYRTYISNKSVSSNSELTIKKQSRSERLVIGTFLSDMVRDVDSTETIKVEDGIFEDVSY